VLISGTGTNLQALIDAPDIDVSCVVSSRPGATGLERAARAGIPATATADEDETAAFLDVHGAELIVLAGYMRILSAAFVSRWSGRILNVHPALLPAFPGARAVEDAVTGPIVMQEALAVSYDDTAAEVTERLHRIEHRLLPEAVRLYGAGKIHVDGRRVRVSG
jgi:phosphoribosylglycinamide formyltransferase-1